MDQEKERELFERCSVPLAIFRLAFPTVIGQIILVIYNMADTFFIGLTKNDAMLTAVTVCMPAFMFLSAISNLFGVGGASVISRALGSKNIDRVKKASSFAFWGCLLTTAAYSVLAALFKDVFIDLLGGSNPEVHARSVQYLTITVVVGGIFTATGVLLSHLIRSEGRSLHASAGIALGGILNIALDPLFMFVILPKGQEALGAAVATMLSNAISLVYFIIVLIKLERRKKSHLGFAIKDDILSDNVPADVFNAGIPACVMTLCENISYAILDNLMSAYGVAAQAGIGVAKKVNMLAHCIVRGISQGSLPLIGYNYASGNHKRMHASIKCSHFIAVGVAALCMTVSLIFAEPLVGIFIHNGSDSLHHGIRFLRILCIGGPFSASAYTFITFFQAVGNGRRSFMLALLRKGLLDIPLMFILGVVFPMTGIVMATPITDAICCVVANVFFLGYMKRLQEETELAKMNAADD